MKVILIGFMGAGKTTVGQLLAKKTNLAFLDTDQLVSQRTGQNTR
ncbi:shikimate kinase [Weissella paramesenteroides]